MQASPVAGTAAFAKFMTVLQAVADAETPLSVAALARACGYPRATVHRIVCALAEHGMLAEAEGGYRMGMRVVGLAARAMPDVRGLLAADLRALRDATGETVHVAVPGGAEMIYIDKLESPGPLRMASRVGAGVAVHRSAVGRAWLASLDPEAALQAMRALPACADPAVLARLRERVAQARADGYATDDEENEAGICCFGIALPGGQACVSVSVLRFRMQGRDTYIQPLLRLRDSAARHLGQPLAQGLS